MEKVYKVSVTFKGHVIDRWIVIEQLENLVTDSIVFLIDEVASITKEFMDSGFSLRSIPPSLIDRLLFIPKWWGEKEGAFRPR